MLSVNQCFFLLTIIFQIIYEECSIHPLSDPNYILTVIWSIRKRKKNVHLTMTAIIWSPQRKNPLQLSLKHSQEQKFTFKVWWRRICEDHHLKVYMFPLTYKQNTVLFNQVICALTFLICNASLITTFILKINVCTWCADCWMLIPFQL